MSPVKSSEFRALIVEPEDSLCTAIVKTYIKFPILFYKWFVWAFKADGSWSTAFTKDVCDAIDAFCPKDEEE